MVVMYSITDTKTPLTKNKVNIMTTKNTSSAKKPAAKKTTAKKRVAKKAAQVTQKNAVMLVREINFPTNHVRISRSATSTWQSTGGKKTQKVTQAIMVKDPDNKTDWDSIAKAKNWKNRVKAIIDRYSLDLNFRGSKLVSIHILDTFREKLNELDAELNEIQDLYIQELPEIIEKDKEVFKEDFDSNLYPTEGDIRSYGLKRAFSQVNSDYFPEESNELFNTAEREKTDRLVTQFSDFVSSITNYISGDTNRFRENSLENVITEAETLKAMDLGHENQEKFSAACDKVIETVNSLNAPAIREAKQKLDKADEKIDTKETSEYLAKESDTLTDALSDLEKECKGLF